MSYGYYTPDMVRNRQRDIERQAARNRLESGGSRTRNVDSRRNPTSQRLSAIVLAALTAFVR